MKFFAYFFLGLTLVCGYFWLTDAKGSGMGYATGISAAVGAGVLYRNWRRTGNAFSNSAGGR
jgi:hypothetical protein